MGASDLEPQGGVRAVTESRPRAGRSPAWSVIKTGDRRDLFQRGRGRAGAPEAVGLAILKPLAR